MIVLALDTATRQATVAVCRDDEVLCELDREVTTHSEGLLSLIHQTLEGAGVKPTELDAVACGRGPGSFTGLRIGMATAKGLCLAAKKPLLCESSLSPLAALTEEVCGGAGLIAAVLDARRKETYCRLYRSGAPLGEELLRTPEELARELAERGEPVVLAGDGALLYQDQLLAHAGTVASLAPEGCHVIRARYLARAALTRIRAGEADDLARAVPLYIRASDAKLPTPRLT